MKTINSFTFYYDFFYLIETLPEDDAKEILWAIAKYMFRDEKPSLEGHNKAIFNTLSHQLNLSKNNAKRSLGKGAPKGNQNAVKKQTKNKPKTNQKQTGGQTENKQNSVLSFKFYISSLNINNNLKEIINKWIDYKLERKEYYKETGFKTLVNRIIKYSEEYSTEEVIDIIEDSISSNYKGIIFTKLNKKPKKKADVPSWFNQDLSKKEETMTEKEKKIYEFITSSD